MARVKLRIVRAQQHIPGGRAKEVGPPPSPTARKHLARCTHAQTLRDRGDAVAKRARCYMCSYAFTRGMRCPALTSGVGFFYFTACSVHSSFAQKQQPFFKFCEILLPRSLRAVYACVAHFASPGAGVQHLRCAARWTMGEIDVLCAWHSCRLYSIVGSKVRNCALEDMVYPPVSACNKTFLFNFWWSPVGCLLVSCRCGLLHTAPRGGSCG